MNIGEKIKNLRTKQGISLDQLALESEVSKSTLIRYEKNQTDVSINNLRSIAYVLNVPMTAFFEEETNDDTRDDPIVKSISKIARANISLEDIYVGPPMEEQMFCFDFYNYGFQVFITKKEFKELKDNIVNFIEFELYKRNLSNSDLDKIQNEGITKKKETTNS